MVEAVTLEAKAAFAGLLAPAGPSPAGVVVCERRGFRLALVQARKGRGEALAARFEAVFGLTLPHGPRRAAGTLVCLGTGPGKWLVITTNEIDLEGELQDVASVIDQTDGLAVLRITGLHARETFAKGAPIDLDASTFALDAVAVSSIAHIGVTIWRTDDEEGFEVGVARSLAGDFWRWLWESAAEYGLGVT